MVFGNQEIRVVTEAVGAAGLGRDVAVASRFDLQPNFPVWIAEGCVADVARVAAHGGHFDQFGHQFRVVRFVRCAGSAVAGRIDAGGPFQGGHLEPAIFAQHPVRNVPSRFGGLFGGVGGERLSIFDDVGDVREIGNRDDLNPVGGEKFANLGGFLAIAAGDDQAQSGVWAFIT